MSMTQNYVGVDIAKDWIDSFDLQTGEYRRRSKPMTISRDATNTFALFPASARPSPLRFWRNCQNLVASTAAQSLTLPASRHMLVTADTCVANG